MASNPLKQFIIPFSGLKPGIHHYAYDVDHQFFEAIEYSLYQSGNVHIDLVMNKEEGLLTFDIYIKGTVDVECDRCLDIIHYPVDNHYRLIFKRGKKWEDVSDEVVIMPDTESEVDMSHYLYEFISLSVPMQCIHPDDEHGQSTCNKEMLKILNQYLVKSSEDPRWEALKQFKEKYFND